MPDDDDPLAHPHHPRVLAVIRAVLLDNRWPKHDLEGAVSEVELRAWASQTPHPTTVGAWKALCGKIAKKMAIDRVRSEKVGGKEATQLTDRVDDHEAATSGDTMLAAIDRRRALEEMAAVVPAEDRPVFDRWALGFTQKEIAKDLSIHPREVSRTVSTLRTRFAMRYTAAAVGALLLVVGAFVVFRDALIPDRPAGPAPSSVPIAPRGPSPEGIASDGAPATRSLGAEASAKLVAALAGSRGQPLQVVCARGAAPSHLCDQLVAAIGQAGWTVTRVEVVTDAAVPRGIVVEVEAGADEGTRMAADALAGGLKEAHLGAGAPEERASGSDATLRLRVGVP